MSSLPLPRDKKPSRWANPGVWVILVIGLVVIIAGFASCQGSASESDTGNSSGVDSTYLQTWEHPYSHTTCADWSGRMTSQQRFAAAADMLTGARNKGDGGRGLPPDSLISEFEAGVTNVCVEPTMTITDAAVGLYLTEDRFKP